MGKPQLTVVDSTEAEPQEEKFEGTFLQSQQPNYYYAKLLDQSTLKLPFWNKFKRVKFNTFEEFTKTLDSLLDKPLITQVLGCPTADITPQDKVRRTAKNFSFALPGLSNEAPVPIKYRYLILDLDREITSPHPKIQKRLQEFKERYETYELNEEQIHRTIRAILAHVFGQVYKGPIYFRASAGFGRVKSPYIRGHIYVPLDQAVSIDELSAFTYAREEVDHTPYFNPTQPIFTAAPIKYKAGATRATDIQTRDQTSTASDESPLSLFPGLKRTYYFKGDEKYLPAEVICQHYSGQILNRRTEYSPDSTLLPATELSGKRGAFNRVARSHEKFSIHKWLLNHGYIPSDDGSGVARYLSPYSSSGSAGTVVYPDGYLVEFHESSPIKDIISQNKLLKEKRIFTAYDLWYIESVQLESPGHFRRMIDQAIALDPSYQKVWTEKLDLMTTFISGALSPQEIDDIIRGILEEVFYAGLKEERRHRIFEAISTKVAALKIKDFKRPISKLQKIFRQIAKDFAADYSTVHPANTDTQNARSFIESSQVFMLPDGSYAAENMRGDMLTLLTTDQELLEYAEAQIPRKSNAPLDWQHGKIVSTAKTVVGEVKSRAKAGEQPALRVSEELHMFRGTDKRRALDYRTGESHSPLLNEFIVKELPFTEAEYNQQKDKKLEETHWGEFLQASFAGYEDNIEHIRDMMSFILMPERPGQQIFAMLGITRSGKSTIKNVLGKLLGKKFTMEKMFKDLKDQFALAELTPLTRMFVINEFNIGSLTRASTQDAVNFLKALSGDDSVAVRRMRTDPIEVHPVAVPVLISNETPHIEDPAFIARLKVVKFRKSFIKEVRNTIEFQENLKAELPFIFEWVRTNPRYQSDKLNFKDSEVSRQDLLEVTEEADPVGAFCKSYVEEAPGHRITRTEFTTAFKCYYEMTMGELPPEGYESTYLRQPALRAHLPSLNHRRERRWISRKELNAMLPEAKARLGGEVTKDGMLVGIDWQDRGEMIQTFSPFSDLPENAPEEDIDV